MKDAIISFGVAKVIVIIPLGHRNPAAMDQLRMRAQRALADLGPGFKVKYVDASAMSMDYYNKSKSVSIPT